MVSPLSAHSPLPDLPEDVQLPKKMARVAEQVHSLPATLHTPVKGRRRRLFTPRTVSPPPFHFQLPTLIFPIGEEFVPMREKIAAHCDRLNLPLSMRALFMSQMEKIAKYSEWPVERRLAELGAFYFYMVRDGETQFPGSYLDARENELIDEVLALKKEHDLVSNCINS